MSLSLSSAAAKAGSLNVYWCGIIVQWLVPMLTSGNISGVITGHGDIVEDQAGWATRVPWFLSVEADVEKLAISWVGEGWVNVGETIDNLCCGILAAAETVVQAFLDSSVALCLELLIGPRAGSVELIEDQTFGTRGESGFGVVALVEAGAVMDVLDGEETVGTWAVETALWGLEFESLGSFTVHVEWEVTFLVTWVVVKEH